MRYLAGALLATFLLSATPGLYAQQTPRVFGQALLGPVVRSASATAVSTAGFQIVMRLGRLTSRRVGLVAEGSLANFPDQPFFAACPAGLPCLAARHLAGGLGIAGLAAGLQPRMQLGPVQLQVTGTAGGYWLYHRRADAPALTPGFRGAVALGPPISDRMHVLLEASAIHVARSGTAEANSRHIGIGVAIN